MNDGIKAKKLIYHLTSLDNVASILELGLLPRANLRRFVDVADAGIIADRSRHGLDSMVPFHFFPRNPFDGRVQLDHPHKRFVLIAVSREVARANGWSIIPRHPLAGEGIEVLGYDEGMKAIDWDAMNKRDYLDQHSKCVCMAECLSPGAVSPARFQSVFVKDPADEAAIRSLVARAGLSIFVNLNPAMFSK